MNFKVLSLFFSFTLLVSCSRQSERVVTVTNEVKVPVEATHVEALVAADAGASLSIGNKIQLTVPAGALSEDANISVTKGAVAAPKENLVPISTSLEMGGHGIEFNKPVALNVCYDVAALVSQNLKEETVQVYYVDPLTGEYAAVGGNVNLAAHCVSAQLTHFSTYLIAAQILQGGNNAPVISAPTFTPTVPMAGLPLKISSVVTDYELTTVNGQIGFGQVATATLYYRIPGEPSFTQVALTPDTLDDTATRYSYKIPANRVTTTGIEYYLKATDNLGANRIRNTVTLPIARTATGIAFQTTVAVDLAAGFKRSYTLRGIDDLGAQRNIEVDSFAVNNGIGTAAKISASVVQFTATTANAQNYRIGSISATAGSFNTTSSDIRVHAGYLDHIALLSPTGVVLGSSITVNANSTYDFDVLGYDAYGNTTNILPQFVIVPVSGAGTISPTGLYTAPATAQTATLVATLDGVMDSILINVVVPVITGWTPSGNLITPRYGHTATKLLDGRVLIVGGINQNGNNTNYLSSAEIFDPAGGGGVGAFVSTGSMAVARNWHTATLLPNGKVLVFGGLNDVALPTTAEVFDPSANSGSGGFTQVFPISPGRHGHIATRLADGRVLIAGGTNGFTFPLQSLIFDSTLNGGQGDFVASGNLITGRYDAKAVTLQNGKVLILGGANGPTALTSAELFDPAANSGSGAFAATGSLQVGRYGMASVALLNNGRVLVSGGVDLSTSYSVTMVELFDPAANSGVGGFSPTGSTIAPRHAAHLVGLTNGVALLTGGISQTSLGVNMAPEELFDPNAGVFSVAPQMVTPRASHSATLLSDGRVVAIGGYSTSSSSIQQAEIFHP